jgi:hypothetical protein
MPRRTGATPLAYAAILLARLLLCRPRGGSPASEPAADALPLLLDACLGPKPLTSALLLAVLGEFALELPLGGLTGLTAAC